MTAQQVFHEANEVTMFLAPLLRVPVGTFTYPYVNRLSVTRYINSYLSEKEDIKILTYGYRDKFYHKFRTNMTNKEHYLYHKELEGGRYDVWTFSMSPPVRRVITLFKEGKYSEFPEDDKIELILNSFLKGKMDILSRILEKDSIFKQLREQELKVQIPDGAELWSQYNEETCIYGPELLEVLSRTAKKLEPNEQFQE